MSKKQLERNMNTIVRAVGGTNRFYSLLVEVADRENMTLCSPYSLRDWLRGRACPSVDNAVLVSKAAGITVDDLFNRSLMVGDINKQENVNGNRES